MPSLRTAVCGHRGGTVETRYLILTMSMAHWAKLMGKNAKIFESAFVVHGDDNSEAQPSLRVTQINPPIKT